MRQHRQPRPLLLVAIGLIGISSYTLALHLPHPAILSNDAVRGFWYGLSLGIEIMGVYYLCKRKKRDQ